MNRLLPDRCVPGETCIRAAGVIESCGVQEHRRACAHFHAVGLEDGDERRLSTGAGSVLFLDALSLFACDAEVDLAGPV